MSPVTGSQLELTSFHVVGGGICTLMHRLESHMIWLFSELMTYAIGIVFGIGSSLFLYTKNWVGDAP